ncbi:MAG: hypothetical protein MJ108_00625 [Saccharofermentans sp.]|nr:hypothetical protein [Saccharofermentans sp.]
MDKNYHTKADLSDYIDRETKLITPFFRLTKRSGLIASILLILSFAYSAIMLILSGIKLDDPFAEFSFSIPFIILLIEFDCIVCMFPAFFKKEYSLLKFILISLAVVSVFNKDFITILIAIWIFISLTILISAENKAKLKYNEYCSNNRLSKSKEESFIYTNPDLTASVDAHNGYAPPIDNSNLFKKKSIYDEDIDLVDMNQVFKPHKNDPEQ